MRYCDICGVQISDPVRLLRDEEGLWVCDGCRPNIHTGVVGNEEEPLGEELEALRGKNAGQITLTLNLPYVAPYRQVIDDAHKMHDMLKSPWQFYTQWADDTTVWRAPDGEQIAIVPREDDTRIEHG